ncbi:tRNA pseudouridine synthase B [Lactobacillus xylocopicola]|uniref:tRNA pseudouridine synthase B n=2 Tax=Lactobacillus xylocopicola TaxID=2976676 RepID=A0ABN6SJV2_9LACO|nr:tRNA pseudouridine synthase B [Lactobacillus xylocopicola]
MNGILVIDKDKGMTSSDVVCQLRKILHTKKIGHAGTLDPDVTGVLPIAVGQATKLIELMHTKGKEYEGTGILGFATDSYDVSGTVLNEKKITSAVSADELKKAMQKFVGTIEQVPPIYSAVRVKGKHLYEYARAGIEVERPRRQVTVSAYDLVGAPTFDEQRGQVTFNFKIACSKGTYVRSLVNDLGTALGVPAVMKSLRRTASSGFDLSQAVKLDFIAANPAQAPDFLQPLDLFFKDYQQVELSASQWLKVNNGAAITLKTNAKKVVLRYNGRVKAIYQKDDYNYRPELMLLQNN